MAMRTTVVGLAAVLLLGCKRPPQPAAVEAPAAETEPVLFVERERLEKESEPRPQLRDGQVYVDPGEAVLGTDAGEVEELFVLCDRFDPGNCDHSWFDTEQPRRHEVMGGYWIDRLEVSNAEYEACVAAGDCAVRRLDLCERYQDDHGWSTVDAATVEPFLAPQRPAVCITIDEAEGYCRSRGKRLPASDEWEKAARGPEGRRWPWGDAMPTCALANFSEPERGPGCGTGLTAEVGSRPDNASVYGALDMAGNVAEWVRPNVGGDGMYTVTPGTEGENEIRGGHWQTEAVFLRGAERGFFSAQERMIYVGFRCAGG
ncbi:MAG: SUMF1/EgtB/PvdO family nonheme iron enzyme [Myxococcales bacterium]|nr:SUMF1/EgtB/PvdO family nonheme iron enzyme [Myxococcales bacterium]